MSFSTLNTVELNGGDDSLLAIITDVLETAVITNPEPEYTYYFDVLETAVASDTAYPTQDETSDVVETAAGGDYAWPTVSQTLDVAETAEANDYATHEYPPHDVLETAVVTETASSIVISTIDIVDSVEGGDAAWPGDLLDITDTAEGNDYATVLCESTLDVVDQAIVSDSYDTPASAIWDVLETASLADATYTQVDALTDVLEGGFISDSYYADETVDALPIWTANCVTWAMTQYDGLSWSGKSGKYAVAPDGLYIESTAYADGTIATGKTDLGSPNLKAMPFGYVYAEHALPMTISVTADVDGVEATYPYTQMARDASDTKAVRCEFGRGFRSTYYQLELVTDGYAKIRNVVPLPTVLSRRI